MKKTVIVFGSNGMLGRYLVSYLNTTNYHNVVPVKRPEIDAKKATYDTLFSFLNKYNGSIVINCIGKIPQRSDNEISDYIKINTLFPHLLSQCCKDTGNKLIHITTDCVFSGSKGDYTELDEHDETNIYGISKSLGEPFNATVIRTSIIGEELENKKSLLESIRSNNGGKFTGFTNHHWNGVTCLQLAKILHHIIDNNALWTGVRHIHSPKSVTKYDLAEMIIDTYELNIELIKTSAINNIDKTLSSVFDMQLEIPDIKNQIHELREFSQYLA